MSEADEFKPDSRSLWEVLKMTSFCLKMIIRQEIHRETSLEARRYFRSKAEKQRGPKGYSGVAVDRMGQKVSVMQDVRADLVTVWVCLRVGWGQKYEGSLLDCFWISELSCHVASREYRTKLLRERLYVLDLLNLRKHNTPYTCWLVCSSSIVFVSGGFFFSFCLGGSIIY